MKARKNPTNEQLARRMRRPPESDRDPRVTKDAYWALRFQGYPHAYAKRAFRDQPPVFHERQISADEVDCDPDDLLFPPGSTWTDVEVAIRPILSEESIRALAPRPKEYTAWDHEVSGFGVRVRSSGHKSYVIHYRVRPETKPCKYTIGKTGEFALDQARQTAREFRQAARAGTNPDRE